MKMVERVYDLGRQGEEVSQRLLASISLGSHLEPIIVLAKSANALAELRRRLEQAAPRFDRLAPGRDSAEQVAELAEEKVKGSAGRRVLWIEADPFDELRWKETLATFNQRREWLRTNAPWLIVLAGPLALGPGNLNNLASRHAPDFFSIAITLLIEEEPELLAPPPSRPLHWLHLSDFHFAALEGWDRRRTLKALLAFLAEKKAAGWRPDFVFATGDIAWSGKEKEYDQAIFFFRELAKTLEIDLPSQLFLIPGNHDVDRGAKGPMDDFMLDGLLRGGGTDQQEQISKALKDSASMRLLGRRLEQYYLFTEKLLGPARRTQSDKPWRVDFREVAGVEVAILQLNSAWASGQAEEKGRLLVGAHQLEEALGEAASAKVRFVLIHHPFDYLADGDAAAIRGRLMDRGGGHFFLRGHLHATAVELAANPDGELIELAAGAVYADTSWPKRFLIGEADLRKGKAAIECFTYSDRGAGFWTVDPLAYRSAKKGRVALDLPTDLKLERSKAPGKARHETAIARYRAAVVAVHGQMRFIGFPAAATGQRPNVAVQELFVPLRLAEAGQGKEKKDLSTAELLALLASGKKKVARFVVLGEPGAGKTTLCRFGAVSFASASEVLPLFLPFRNYVRQCRESGDCSLLDYLAGEARHHLQVGAIDSALLDEALARGGAVLFLDGLDEVGNELERTRMRERVVAFCERYPKVPVLLTSRYAGYDQAPMPEAFRRLDLKAFEDEDLRVFVGNWYAVQEPNDPVVRERGIADLLAAFATEPRVRALAANPLLATLIALVHRSEARLPGERAKLYELCVRTLLETWPWQSERRFPEIDEGLQRAHLEEFALRQQRKRSNPAADVSFGREDLVTDLADLLGRGGTGTPPETRRRVAERWVEYLAGGTGIIVEQQPGVFAFLHLSLLEYLAACALDRQEQNLESQIEGLYGQAGWQEVLLLAVGRHATDLPFLERLAASLKGPGDFFLLLCLREEAAFPDNRRTAILDSAASRLLELLPYQWRETEAVVRTMERFSVRHGSATAAWRRNRLESSRGDDLRSAVAISYGNPDEALAVLERRADRSGVAADLLEFWPGSRVGAWALALAAPRDLVAFAAQASLDLAVIRAMAALEDDVPAAAQAAWAFSQLRASAHFCGLARIAAQGLAMLPREGGLGLPGQIAVRGASAGVVMPKWPRGGEAPQAGEVTYFARDFARDFARYFARDFARDFARYFARDFALDFALEPSLQKDRAPEDVEVDIDRSAFETYRANPEKAAFEAAAVAILSRRIAEAWIALATTARSSRQEAEAYLPHRLQNVAMLYLWPNIDQLLPAAPEPEKLALYLQLGWTQSTTTHEWPATERWIALMKAGPPEHWLPRAQWHLCWLLHDNTDAEHQRAFNEALREGLADTDICRHAVAETLEQVIGFYP